MPQRRHVFGDESGNLHFSRKAGASRYFMLTTVTFFDDFQACADINQLRRELAWRDIEHPGAFHATEDSQEVRNEVFKALAPHAFRVDTTIFEKSKAQPQTRLSEERFYQYAWFYHMKYVAPQIASAGDEVLAVAASIGTKKRREAFYKGVKDVMSQVLPKVQTKTACWPADSEAGLQIADYCGWAVFRRWESGDGRSRELIADKIKSEFDIWRHGTTHYY